MGEGSGMADNDFGLRVGEGVSCISVHQCILGAHHLLVCVHKVLSSSEVSEVP